MIGGTTPRGMRKGLTRYGDEGFSLFLCKAFIKAMGFSDDALDRPIVGIADTASDYSACHANVPRLGSPRLLEHTGSAVVFDSLENLAVRVDDPDLDVAPEDVLVLRGAGPKGAPGMPEAGYIPIPKKLALRGVKDMVRLSNARMSGTAFGTIVLHVTQESAIGGPLALVETGDRIRLGVGARRLDLLVPEKEIAARRERWSPPPAHPGSERGYLRLFLETVTGADRGCDFDFMGRPPASPLPGSSA